MKLKFAALAALVIAGSAIAIPRLSAAQYGAAHPQVEYLIIRWDNRTNTHIVHPDGQVEFIGPDITGVPRPDHTDERALYMTLLMNKLAKEGYEFAGMASGEQVLMKRTLH